jgi:hypothetical protein
MLWSTALLAPSRAEQAFRHGSAPEVSTCPELLALGRRSCARSRATNTGCARGHSSVLKCSSIRCGATAGTGTTRTEARAFAGGVRGSARCDSAADGRLIGHEEVQSLVFAECHGCAVHGGCGRVGQHPPGLVTGGVEPVVADAERSHRPVVAGAGGVSVASASGRRRARTARFRRACSGRRPCSLAAGFSAIAAALWPSTYAGWPRSGVRVAWQWD